MDMFAASDLEGIGECAVHFFIISPAPTWGNGKKARICMCDITGNGRRGNASLI